VGRLAGGLGDGLPGRHRLGHGVLLVGPAARHPDARRRHHLLLVVLAASSRAGLLAASAFLLGTGVSSALLLAAGGQLFIDWWGIVPASALAMGASLFGIGLLRDSRAR
jgi:hypothetical protein